MCGSRTLAALTALRAYYLPTVLLLSALTALGAYAYYSPDELLLH
jgi:hypothetical protein